jgi:hypothetical protein
VIKIAHMIQSCVRCGAPAGIVMSFNYGDRHIWLDDMIEPVTTGRGFAMCQEHAGRLTPPVGWTLSDRRMQVPRLFAPLEVA